MPQHALHAKPLYVLHSSTASHHGTFSIVHACHMRRGGNPDVPPMCPRCSPLRHCSLGCSPRRPTPSKMSPAWCCPDSWPASPSPVRYLPCWPWLVPCSPAAETIGARMSHFLIRMWLRVYAVASPRLSGVRVGHLTRITARQLPGAFQDYPWVSASLD